MHFTIYLYPMHSDLKEQILKHTGAHSISKVELVQSLWSDFGSLERVWLSGVDPKSIVIKRIQPPSEMLHPRGWNTNASSERKLKSYEIERHWYEKYVHRLPAEIKVPQFLFHFQCNGENVLGMEDLLDSGFEMFYDSNEQCFNLCLEWLARFHAFHMNKSSEGLWSTGTYWHLDTRQDEWNAMPEGDLKKAAKAVDIHLKQRKYQTLVHGDAKPANFCFTSDFKNVAAVDFQYVGSGCGMKDLIYLMSSSLSEEELFRQDQKIINGYLNLLEKYLQQFAIPDVNIEELKAEWLACYPIAWVDFQRFLIGWDSGNRRVNDYMSVQSKLVLGKGEG